jgi:IclR family acetate operon transcriptional repressor
MEDYSRSMEANDATGAKAQYNSHALLRGLRILDAVAARGEPLSFSRLHEITGQPKSTLVRLLSVLETAEYVVKVDERPAYRLGHAMLPIVAGYFQSGSLSEVVRPHLRRLAVETGWTANFGILDGTQVRHLGVEFPDRPLRYTTAEGTLAPTYCTGLGKAILSALPDAEAHAAAPGSTYPALTDHTITTWKALSGDLALARERGYAIDAEEAAIGLRCLAVPVVTAQGVLGALSVSGPAGESDRQRDGSFVAALLQSREQLLLERGLETALGLTLR